MAGKDNLVEYFGNIVLRGNQHAVINVVGSTGSGKSSFAGGLIIGLANYLGEKLDRDPREFFNFKRNLACMNLDRVQEVMADPDEYNLIWLDDMGPALNSRKFYTIQNMDFNDVLQTFRPNRNILIITEPQESLIDKVIRKIAHYHVELTHKLFETHNIPMTACKVKKIEYKHTQDQTWYPYLQDDTGRYVQYITPKAPDIFLTEYDKIRKEEYNRMLQMKKDAKEENKIQNKPKITIKEMCHELQRDITAGMFEGKSEKQACKERGINHGTYRNYKL